MSDNKYSNFVRPTSPTEPTNTIKSYISLSGEEAKKFYLEEVRIANESWPQLTANASIPQRQRKRKIRHENNQIELKDKDLFIAVENNDVNTVREFLKTQPDKISIVDDYGWSLLMIACQANSIETVKVLLSRGVDTSIRDKAGNSAQSLVIKNKNFALANILISHNDKHQNEQKIKNATQNNVKLKDYHCPICNQVYPDGQEHLSSTVHNINASKGRKIPSNYVIPQTNKGYQIMVKVGWDRDSGLGPEGEGKKYPIKTVEKRDRKGLGHKKDKEKETKDVKHKGRSKYRSYESNKHLEVKFRREFY